MRRHLQPNRTRARYAPLAAGILLIAAGPCAALLTGCTKPSKTLAAPRGREGARSEEEVLAGSLPCDGAWRTIGGEWSEQCRCWLLDANEPAPTGSTAEQAVAHFNQLPPLTLASDDGLLQRVGLRSGGCGRETSEFRFAALDTAEYDECRPQFGPSRGTMGTLKIPGQLSVAVQGGTLRVDGELVASQAHTFTFHSDGSGAPLSLSGMWNAQSSSVIASPAGSPQPTASWSSSASPAPDIAASAAASFGQPLERVFSELVVDAASCRLDNGAVGGSEMAAPVRLELESLVQAPCSARGAPIRLRISADSFRHARAEGHASWSATGPVPAPAPLPGEAEQRSLIVDAVVEEVAAPSVVRSLVHCAAGERLSSALRLSAARDEERVRVRLTQTWSPRCEDATVSCEIEAHVDPVPGG